ncbi:MAG: hypothetical protein ABSG48_08465 [Geobacteraceae bacterium]
MEGDVMSLAYRWKQTIGDVSERRTQFNIWNYFASHGLGFHEYLQLCEDLVADCFPATQKVQSFSNGPAGAFSVGECE